MLNTITELDEFLKEFPEHKVALPECLFNKYSLYKTTLRGGKGKLIVVQEEYIQSSCKNEGPGYHIDKKEKYTKFLKKFHFHGFGSLRMMKLYQQF